MARRVVRRFSGEVLVNEHDGSRTHSAHHGGCGDSIPNLCKSSMFTVRAQIEKCSQVLSVLICC